MSPKACPRCLLILSRNGWLMVARENGVEVNLPVAPKIFNEFKVDQIDYRPEFNVRQIMPRAEKWRDLEREEVIRIDTWLIGMARAVHDFVKKEE